VRFALVFEPQRLVAQQSRRPQFYRSFRQRKRYALEARQTATECRPFCDVFAGFLDALLRCADAHQPDQRAAEIKALHHFDKTGPLFADAGLGGYSY